MKVANIIICLSALLLVTVTAQAADDCSSNYTKTGSLASGLQYNTSEAFAGVAQRQAFQRVYAFTAQNGFTIDISNEDAGLILASKSESYGHGKAVSLNVTVKPEGAGSRVIITYATSGAVMSPSAVIQQHFCKTMAAVAQR